MPSTIDSVPGGVVSDMAGDEAALGLVGLITVVFSGHAVRPSNKQIIARHLVANNGREAGIIFSSWLFDLFYAAGNLYNGVCCCSTFCSYVSPTLNDGWFWEVSLSALRKNDALAGRAVFC